MALVLAGWLYFGSLLIGLGLLFSRLAGGRRPRLGQVFWIGWACACALLQLTQLAWPVGPATVAALTLLATLGWSLERRVIGHLWPKGAVTWGVLTAICILILLAAQGPARNGDSGVYHHPAVLWMSLVRLAPGLANLNPLLGLNSAHFLFEALVSVGPWKHVGNHVGPSLLVVALALQAALGALETWRAPRAAGDRAWMSALFMPLVVDLVMGRDLTSESPDLPIAIVGAVLWIELVAEFGVVTGESSFGAWSLPALALILGAGLSTKLSFAMWALTMAVMIGALIARGPPESALRRSLGALIALSMTFGVWILRTWLLTGCPFYPSAVGCTEVGWKLPSGVVDVVERYVIAWGRWSGGPKVPVMGTWTWLGPWLQSAITMNRAIVIPGALTLGILITGFVTRRLRRSAALLVPLLAGLLFWLLTSPDVRFAGALIWGLPATAAFLVVGRGDSSQSLSRVVIALTAALALYPVIDPVFPMVWSPLRPQALPKPGFKEYRTVDGLLVTAPQGGACWDLDPPCTSFPRSGLRRRGSALASGFVWGDAEDSLPAAIPHTVIPVVK